MESESERPDPETMEFVLGFIAGEGSFFITMSKDDRYRNNVCVGARFVMSMGQFEEEVLSSMREIYDIGSVHTTENGYKWVVSNRVDCHLLRDLINEHVTENQSLFTTAHKYEAFQTWSEALDILEPNSRLSEDDLLQLVELKGDINQVPNGRSLSEQELKAAIRSGT